MPSPLEALSLASGREFPNLLTARALTQERLVAYRKQLAQLPHDEDSTIVLMGSWGRAELTSGSDDDFMLLVHGAKREKVRPSLDRSGGFSTAPRPLTDRSEDLSLVSGSLGISVYVETGTRTSRGGCSSSRSPPGLPGSTFYSAVMTALLERYLDQSVSDYRVPRFLLNDVIRYWRTICVDFAAKEHRGPDKWAVRNAKLRTSRKLLFCGAMLPCFACAGLRRNEMIAFLASQLAMPPTDRVAQAFLENDAADWGGRALGAYDDFLGLLDDPDIRDELSSLSREDSLHSEPFAETKRLGELLEQGLLALMFESSTQLPAIVRDYAIL
jgi:hypothetical protein